ncbi:MAG: GGDEF domain-containing protein [Methylibium sp.]|uniref:GGDEF domain-containing protein n=1 Tax=Methylibium sp. TaxID=2067992 RepID=UPI001841B517|nr:GGDEF domain-containing protein [Methylibium sp.]MBA3596715.1 GGDEF domain-containing protein [Methylibium sp.]
MPDLIGSVVSLTGFRDRDLVNTKLVSMLADWLDPLAVSLYRCVGDPSDLRLLRQAGQRRGQAALRGDPPWVPLEALPAASDWPQHHRALLTGERVRGVDTRRCDDAGEPALLSVFPIVIGQKRFGVIEVLSERPLSDEHCELITGLLQVYRNHMDLLDYSEHDMLTGLLNRKTFEAQFAKGLGATACAPAGSACTQWLGVIDIDHFKRVNDDFGHLIGDEVLLLVARLLRSAFRHGDRLYRFGGEEFVVVLRADERAHAALAFERFRARMEAFTFPQVGPVTASVGFTQLRPLDIASGAFARADRAIYHAKQTGRNRVCCHETLVESGALSGAEKSGEIELF